VAAVVLLASFSYSIALMGPVGPWSQGDPGAPSLEEAEEVVRSYLSDVLDAALGRAIPVAAMAPGVDVSAALDAFVALEVGHGPPSNPGGWDLDLVDVRGGLEATAAPDQRPGEPSGMRTPFVTAVVQLGADPPGSSRPIRLVVTVRAPGGEVDGLVVRGASLTEAFKDPHGPVGYMTSGILWQKAQSRAMAGEDGTGSLLTEWDVEEAIRGAVAAIVGGTGMPSLRPPDVDLEVLVRQSVHGMLDRNLGWVLDYVIGLDGMDLDLGGPIEALISRVSDMVADVTLAILEISGPEGLPVIRGEDLAHLVSQGIGALGGLRTVLRSSGDGDGPAMEVARTAVLKVVPRLPSALADRVASVLVTAGRAVALLAIECAEDALLAVGLKGRQIAEGGRPLTSGGEDLQVDLDDLVVTTRWSGVKACEPPGLVRGAFQALIDGGDISPPGLGSLPYTSVCSVGVEGNATFKASTVGAPGKPLETSWRVPVQLGWDVEVVSGRGMGGVGYVPSATLSGDLARVGDAILGALGGVLEDSVAWLTCRLRDAAEMLAAWAGDLWSDMEESVMTESAYTLSRALWKIGDALIDNRTDKALNATWDLLVDLFGEDLREAFTWRFDLMGSDLVVAIDPLRQQVEVRLSKGWLSLNVTVRRLCEPHPPFRAKPIEGYYWGVFGEARMDLGDRKAVLFADPLTLERGSVLTMELSWGGDDGGGKLTVEALEARKLRKGWGVSLSELAGGARLLSMTGGASADVGLSVHGDLMKKDALKKALRKAVKDAWLATMRGWKVGDLLGRTGRGPDGTVFVEMLLRELHNALVDRAGDLVSEVEVYIELDFPSPGWPDVRLSLVLSEPLEALLPLVVWVRESLTPLANSAVTGSLEGAGTALASWLSEHVRVRFELAWGVKPPEWLTSRTEVELPAELGLVLRGEVNVAALGAVAGRRLGKWEVSVEVLLRGLPGAVLVVVPGMGSPKWKWAEVTLVRVTVEEVRTPRILISQVLYDARGEDAALEYVELVNAGDRIVDLDGFRLRDDSGTFRLRGHLPVLPGDHLLVARNASAVRELWGVTADLGRMGLRLANDGDMVEVQDPEGVRLDMVAWEGQVEGWEGLETAEGLALVRSEGDLRQWEPGAWEVGRPSPRRSGW
jgi:hypothetical protein